MNNILIHSSRGGYFFYDGTEYIEHHGVLGQKWGVRRYQNKDGSLTAEGKKYKATLDKANAKRELVFNEGQKLINKSKQLSDDFGKSYKNVDDDEFFEVIAREYGLDTNSYWKANMDYKKFVNQNRDSIKIGKKIAEAELAKK